MKVMTLQERCIKHFSQTLVDLLDWSNLQYAFVGHAADTGRAGVPLCVSFQNGSYEISQIGLSRRFININEPKFYALRLSSNIPGKICCRFVETEDTLRYTKGEELCVCFNIKDGETNVVVFHINHFIHTLISQTIGIETGIYSKILLYFDDIEASLLHRHTTFPPFQFYENLFLRNFYRNSRGEWNYQEFNRFCQELYESRKKVSVKDYEVFPVTQIFRNRTRGNRPAKDGCQCLVKLVLSSDNRNFKWMPVTKSLIARLIRIKSQTSVLSQLIRKNHRF